MAKVEQRLREAVKKKGAGYMVLIDPDKQSPEQAARTARQAEAAGADAILVGSSITLDDTLNQTLVALKKAVSLPIIIFPGSSTHVSQYADAVFFMSLLSGRNPEYLIGEQVKAAPLVKKYGVEAIPVAYIIIEGGRTTSVEFVSNTRPIPRDKPDIAVAHALAAKYMGFRMIYLEAGSGASESVPEEMIRSIKEQVGDDIPIIVGGGIRSPELAKKKLEAGASFIVTGTVIEDEGKGIMKSLSKAIHKK